jgi:phage shock protein PspC (stress-responsive transcriptional regulator)
MNIGNTLPIEPTTIGLLVVLCAVFIVGLKLVHTLVSTVVVSAFCGGFYIAAAILLDYTLTVDRVLQFAVLGNTVYFGLKFVSGAYGFTSSLLRAPLRILSAMLIPFQRLADAIKSDDGSKDSN